MRPVRLLWLSILVISLLSLASVLLGDVGLDEPASALDPNTHVEDRPGTILYDDWGPYEVWESDKRANDQCLSAESQLLSADVDLDGEDELLFGTLNGSLIVLDVPSGDVLMNKNFYDPSPYHVYSPYVAVGNLDQDKGREILFCDGKALYCIDFLTQRVLWTSDIIPGWGSTRSQGPISLVDPDGDGVDDILLRSNKRYYRLDNEGQVVHNVSLEVFEDPPPWMDEYLGWPTRMIVDDLDDDGEDEVFISDYGTSLIPEIYNRGHHAWVIDLKTGVMEYAESYNFTIFWSDPLLFELNGSKFVAIGLHSYGDGDDLIIIDLKERTYEMVNVYNVDDTFLYFNWLSLIPSDNDTVLLLGSHNFYAIAWSFLDREVRWVSPGGSGGAYVESPLVICDIDNDAVDEVLLPVGPVHVLDATTGERETILDINGPQYSGERTAVGDFDGDGFTEICQGLYYIWDKVYRVVYIDTNVITYDIVAPSGPRPLTLYAGVDNQLNILIVNMTEPRLPATIDLTMSNGPWGTFGEHQVDPVNGTHVTTKDGLLALSGFTIEHTEEGTFINLTLVPQWNFSYEDVNDLTVGFTSAMGFYFIKAVEDLFLVERDLELVGDITVEGPEGVLEEGDWLHPHVAIGVTDMDVVYQGTSDLHPPRDVFTLQFFDGAVWSNVSFFEGERLQLAMTSPEVDGVFNIVVRINQVPAGKFGIGTFEISLRVDGTAPYVVGSFPDNGSWFSVQLVPFTVLVTDGGSGVDPGTIEFALVRDLNVTQKVWQHVLPEDVTEVDRGFRAWSEYSFSEGSTVVLWRFMDRMGHRASFVQVINVDLQGISFHDFSPVGWVRLQSQNISVQVSVSDRGGSGVNRSSLEWSYSHTDLLSFSEWAPVGVSEQDGQIIASLKYDGVEGTSNLIRLRGRDMAGNELISSQVYSVWIDTEYPWVEVVDPYLMYRQDPALRSVRVNVTDWTSGIGGVVAYLHETNGEGTWNLTVELVEGTEHWAVYVLSWTESTLPTLDLEVRVWDNAGNNHGSHHRIVLDRCPSIIEMSPQDGASFENGTVVNFTVVLEDPDGDELSVEWWLGDVLLSDEANFSTSSLPVGEHDISVIVMDRYHEVTGRLGITVTEVPEEPEEPQPEEPPKVTLETDPWSPWWLVVIVVSISLVVGLMLFRLRYAEVR